MIFRHSSIILITYLTSAFFLLAAWVFGFLESLAFWLLGFLASRSLYFPEVVVVVIVVDDQ